MRRVGQEKTLAVGELKAVARLRRAKRFPTSYYSLITQSEAETVTPLRVVYFWLGVKWLAGRRSTTL